MFAQTTYMLLLLFFAAGQLYALNKRGQVHIPASETLPLELNSSYTGQKTDQYNVLNQRVNSVKNSSLSLKTLLYSFNKNLLACLLRKNFWPEDDSFTTDGTVMFKRPVSADRTGLTLRAIC